jgi:hypothetical protein
MKLQSLLYTNMINDNNNVIIGNHNNHDESGGVSLANPKDKGTPQSKKPKPNYVKVLVEDPFNNRDIIMRVTKKQFTTLAKKPEGNSGLNPNWVTGFCDAESCIGFRIRKNNKLNIG